MKNSNRPLNRLLRIALATAFGLLAGAAPAEDSPADRYFKKRVYVGASVGASKLAPDTSRSEYLVGDDTDTVKSLHLGIDFSKHWTVEAYVVDLGQAEILCKSDCTRAGEITYEHAGISAIGYFLNRRGGEYYDGGYDDEGLYRREGLSAFGRIGIGKMDNETALNYKRLNDVHLHVGGGLEYGWENGFAARAEVISYDTDALAASMGLIKRFGDSEPYLGGPPVVPPELEAPPTAAPPATLPAPTATPGKPATAAKPVKRKIVRIRLPRLYFAVDDHRLSPLAQRKLLDLVRTMKRYPRLKLEIRGYTDATASMEYNLNLSLRRAAAVRKFMAAYGIPPTRLKLAALSEQDPIADNSTPEGRAKNRRVEFRIIR